MQLKTIWFAALLAAPTFAVAEVVYGGSNTIAEALQGGAIKAFEAKSGGRVQLGDLTGTGKGLKLLADGKLTVVGSGRTLSPDEKKSGLLGTIFAYDGLAVFVNKANPVKDLSKEQLKDLFMGKVASWKALGGKDGKISAMIEPLASKRVSVLHLQEQVLDGARFGPGVRELEHLKDQITEVARNEGAICVASVAFLTAVDPATRANIKTVMLDSTEASDANIRSGAYLLSRPMLLVTKGLPAGDVKAFLDFMLSREGQAIVERYFVAVKK